MARKLLFFGPIAKDELERQITALTRSRGKFQKLQFDEMETLEHTKCKPVSIPLLVDAKTRLVLNIDACSMPAKGLLSAISYKKYGKRADHRHRTLTALMRQAGAFIEPQADFLSDSCPRYPQVMKRCFPNATHRTVLSRRGCVVGQGELKRGGWDPLFSLNHTCAAFRADNSRLIRRTWNTTKKIARLKDHLLVCAIGHNRRILAKLKIRVPHFAI